MRLSSNPDNEKKPRGEKTHTYSHCVFNKSTREAKVLSQHRELQ